MSALSVVCLAAALSACGQGKSVADSQSFAFSGPTLTIDARESTVTIDNGAPGKIGVDRTLSEDAGRNGSSMGLDGTVLKLWVECGGGSVYCAGSHTVHVPPGVAIDLKSSGGHVRGVGLAGNITATLRADGVLDLDQPSGVLAIDAEGGGITVTGGRSPRVSAVAVADGTVSLSFAVPPERIEAKSTGGSATVTLPAGPETYRIDGQGISGSPPSDAASKRTVLVQSDRGEASVRKAG
ncbi:hypothetical protein [Amycolatopsis sp. CA-230715]|uniref:hypothetical protein n=1 Tax=Amycolatopsis sp. CA-230715 TaxID=2745196 RepID=UPI001C032916|nr:hypothetical protein [Amycolatopsis sp. CA-230715]